METIEVSEPTTYRCTECGRGTQIHFTQLAGDCPRALEPWRCKHCGGALDDWPVCLVEKMEAEVLTARPPE